MIEIGNTIVGLDVIEKKFVCDVPVCLGTCCVQGDSGAPLEEDEGQILEEILEKVKPYISGQGLDAIEKQGVHIIDGDGDLVTPLINNKECAFTIFENGIAACSIEKAYFDKKVSYRKPISCQLYPIRLTEYSDFIAVNYHHWDVCGSARELGHKQGVPAYRFLKDPLIRKFGEEWYEQLVAAAEYIELQNG